MAIINFSEGDRLAAVVMDPNWYGATITEIRAEVSTSKKSNNYKTRFVLDGLKDGRFAGKEIELWFNSEMSQASVLGTLQLKPAHDILIMRAAIENKPVAALNLQTDTDTLIGSKLDIKLDRHVVEDGGGLINIVAGFAPHGSGTSGPAF